MFIFCTTHIKISQLVASLQTSRQQVVFARLVTSCQQVWNKLLTTWNNLVDNVRLVTRLFQQGCYNHDMTILLQPCVVNLVTFLLYHDCIKLVSKQPCNKSDNAIKLVTRPSSRRLQQACCQPVVECRRQAACQMRSRGMLRPVVTCLLQTVFRSDANCCDRTAAVLLETNLLHPVVTELPQ